MSLLIIRPSPSFGTKFLGQNECIVQERVKKGHLRYKNIFGFWSKQQISKVKSPFKAHNLLAFSVLPFLLDNFMILYLSFVVLQMTQNKPP